MKNKQNNAYHHFWYKYLTCHPSPQAVATVRIVGYHGDEGWAATLENNADTQSILSEKSICCFKPPRFVLLMFVPWLLPQHILTYPDCYLKPIDYFFSCQ